MKKNHLKFGFILFLLTLLTGCPRPVDGAQDPQDGPNTNETLPNDSLTKKIAAATTSLDFENKEIAEDAEVSKAITINNLKLGGKTLTVKASGTELQNVSNATIIIDQQVGDGDVILTGCSDITKLVVNGGGSNSIHIKNSKVASIEVKKDAVRVAMEGTSKINAVVVNAANTKIESEEEIVIKAITVNESVDKVTVKGGTVEKVQVVAFDTDGKPTDAPSESQGESHTSAQIIIDGKTDIKTIEGTKDVQLTKEAIQNGSNVVVKAPVPVVTYYDDTIVFLSNGDLTGTEFENKDFYYYEYIFDCESDNKEMNEMNLKFKIYKLPKSIRLFMYASSSDSGVQTMEVTNNEVPGTIIDSKTFSIKRFTDTTLVLKFAGLVKGTFTEDRVKLETPVYDQEFDIKDCGIPEEIVLPESPKKPVVTVTATAKGNKITVSNESIYYKCIEIYEAEKDSNNEWKPTKTKIFSFDDYNNENPPASTSMEFLDSYVTEGKEYAYYVDTDEYDSTVKYYSSNKNPYVAVTATGGTGEISIQAENTSEGIKITVPYFSEKADTVYFDSLLRTSGDKNIQHINNLNNLKGQPVTDYFVTKNNEYTYTLDNYFWYKNENYRYRPHSNTCTVTATGGVGETIITNSPVATTTNGSVELDSENTTIQFTTAPKLGISSIPVNFTIDIYFRYFKQLSEDSTASESFTVNYLPEVTEVTANASNLVEHFPNSTLMYDNFYEVYIRNESTSTDVTYQYWAYDADFAGLPEKLIIE